MEFWTHTSRRGELHQEVVKRHERQLDGVAAMLTEVARRSGVEFVMPAREVARRGTALGRGLARERLVDPDSTAGDHFEDLFSALVLSLTRPRA